MTGPKFAPIDDNTADLLTLITSDPRHDDDYQAFLAACRVVAAENHGRVTVSQVSERLTNKWGLTIEPRRYSAYWSKATGKNGPLRNTAEWDTRKGSTSHNDGRPTRVREWIEDAA
jgi:hypothetical protein